MCLEILIVKVYSCGVHLSNNTLDSDAEIQTTNQKNRKRLTHFFIGSVIGPAPDTYLKKNVAFLLIYSLLECC